MRSRDKKSEDLNIFHNRSHRMHSLKFTVIPRREKVNKKISSKFPRSDDPEKA